MLTTKREVAIIYCGILAPPQCLPTPTPQYLFILMTERERGRHYLLEDFGAPPPQCPPHSPDATILIYLNDREGAPLSFVGFWRPQCPPSPDATILKNLNDREGASLCLQDFSASINAPPPPTTPQYLTILMTERGGAINFCRIWRPPPMPPPPQTSQ